jgi:hypothetical protein
MNYRRARVGGWDIRLLGFALLIPALVREVCKTEPGEPVLYA